MPATDSLYKRTISIVMDWYSSLILVLCLSLGARKEKANDEKEI
jgi:hypothetical protein